MNGKRSVLLAALVALVAAGLLWLSRSDAGHVASPFESPVGNAPLEPTDRDGFELATAQEVAQAAPETPGIETERVDLTRRSKPRAKHRNPPSVHVLTRLVVDGRPGPYISAPVRYRNRRRSWRLGTTTIQGLEHTLSRPGGYRFYIDPKALPERFVLGDHKSPGVFAEFPATSENVQLGAGERFETELFVFESRRLTGQVVSPTGDPIPGAKVVLHTRISGGLKFADADTTDRYGRFAFLGLFPMAYELVASPPVGGSGSELGGTRPLAFDLTGRSLESRRIALGAGGVEIYGRVLDESGAPLVGLLIQLRYLKVQTETEPPAKTSERQGNLVLTGADGEVLFSGFEPAPPREPSRPEPRARKRPPAPLPGGSVVVTRANGEFHMLGVQPSPLEIRIGPDGRTVGTRTKPLAKSKLITIDLTDTEDVVHDLGEHRLERSDHFELSGRVVLTADRYEGKRIRLNRLRMHAEYEKDNRRSRRELKGSSVQFDRDTGEFTVHCSPELQLLHVQVYPWNRREHAKEFSFPVEAFGVQRNVELEYP